MSIPLGWEIRPVAVARGSAMPIPASSTPYYLNRSPRLTLNGRQRRRASSQYQQPESDNNAEKSHSLDLFQQDIEIQSGAAPEVGCVVLQKDLRRSSPLIVQQGVKIPIPR